VAVLSDWNGDRICRHLPVKVVNTGDTDFLAKVWPALNHAMAYVVDQQQQRR